MKKLMMCAALAGVLLFAPRPALADPAREFDDAMKQLQDGLPVLMRTLQVLQREGPALMNVMQKASLEAQKNGGPVVTTKPGEMPTADEMAQKIRGLQAMADVMKQAMPILTRMQRDLDGVKMHPPYRPSQPGAAPPPSRPTDAQPQAHPKSGDPDLKY